MNLSLHAADLNKKLISACWKGNGKRPNDYFKMNLGLASSIQISVVFFRVNYSEAWDYHCGEEHLKKRCDQTTEEIKITGESCLLFEN